jgi:hypothetical protein
MVARPVRQRVIVISGIRYNVDIRLDMPWSYGDEWSDSNDGSERDSIAASTSSVTCERADETHEVRFKTEPWLCAEIARGEKSGRIR